MKNKKIFKTILLIAIILLAVGCGLASCKKTNAYDDIEPIVQSGSGICVIYSSQLGYSSNGIGIMGFDLSTVYDVNDDMDISEMERYSNYVYAFTEKGISGGGGYTDLIIYFYRDFVSGQSQLFMGYFVGAEGVIRLSAKHQFALSNQDFYIMVNFAPGYLKGNNYVEYCVLTANQMELSGSPMEFTRYGGINTIEMLSETYTDYDFEDDRAVYDYERTTQHFNEVIVITGAPNLPIDYVIYGYNTEMARLYDWVNQLRKNGYYSGYNNGYQEGLDASDEQAYQEGYNYGYQLGQNEGYNTGYQAGMSGDNAVSSFINILASIFTGVGAIFSIELFPHVTIGLFFLVPLFFGVLGLILWIWRHN